MHGHFAHPEKLTTLQFLKQSGFSDLFIERFWRPFFGGVFLENELSTPADFFLFTLKMFATGTATLPAAGMSALPQQLAAQIARENLRLNTPVMQIAPGRIVLRSGEEITASKIVIATEASVACPWLGIHEPPVFREAICVYFTAPAPPHDEPLLMLNAQKDGLIQTLTVQTNICPTYSMGRKPLICVSIVKAAPSDDTALEGKLRGECAEWFGHSAVAQWRLLKIYRIARALPPCHFNVRVKNVLKEKEKEGILVCGDWLETPSINGALQSGRTAAEKIAALIKAR